MSEYSPNPISAALIKACLERSEVNILLQGRHLRVTGISSLVLPHCRETRQLSEQDSSVLRDRVGLKTHSSPFVVLEAEIQECPPDVNHVRVSPEDWPTEPQGQRLMFNSKHVALFQEVNLT